MSTPFNKGAACFVLAFMTVSPFATAAAGTGKAPRQPAWTPQTSSYASPAIWSGIYLGASAGYGWGDSEQGYDRNDNHGLASTSPEGVLAALTAGYNYDAGGGIILGLEADLGLMDLSAGDKVVYDGHIYKSQFGSWWGTLRGRAGYAFDNTMVYGTAGVAFMDVDDVSIGNTPGETATNRGTRTGWVLGAGVEQALTTNMSVKLEYLHMDFARHDGLSGNQEAFYFDDTVDLVRAGVNFKY